MFLDIEGDNVTKDNATGLKEGGGIEIQNYSASIRDARSLRLNTHLVLLVLLLG